MNATKTTSILISLDRPELVYKAKLTNLNYGFLPECVFTPPFCSVFKKTSPNGKVSFIFFALAYRKLNYIQDNISKYHKPRPIFCRKKLKLTTYDTRCLQCLASLKTLLCIDLKLQYR